MFWSMASLWSKSDFNNRWMLLMSGVSRVQVHLLLLLSQQQSLTACFAPSRAA
jgi:hypothetical protein